MATPYLGVQTPPGGQDSPSAAPSPGSAPTVNLPDSSDGGAAFFWQPLRTLADWIAYAYANGMFAGTAATVSAIWTFTRKIRSTPPSETEAGIEGTTIPSVRQLILSWPLTSAMKLRLYASPAGYELVLNASFETPTTGKWHQENGSAFSLRLRLNTSGAGATVTLDYQGTAAADWVDGAWSKSAELADTSATFYKLLRTISADLLVDGEATAVHFISSSGAPTIAVSAHAGVGATAAVTAGTDMGGLITIHAGTGSSSGTIATVSFAVPFASEPQHVAIVPASQPAWALGSTAQVRATNITTNGFDLENVGAGNITASSDYLFSYVVIP
jgi:hypothetical protein